MKKIQVVAAIIMSKDKYGKQIVFATQRGYGELKGGWEFPGGKTEEGEKPQEALKREIMEELETEIEVGELIDTIEYDYPNFHLTMKCFKTEIISGELILKEHMAAKWLRKEELNDVEWLPADITLIEKIEKIMREADRKTEINVLYEKLERLWMEGKIVSTYGGCEDDFTNPDGDVLAEFMEHIYTYYTDVEMEDWMEALIQVLCWQYQSMHEGVRTYYENFYDTSTYPEILRTAEYLKKNGYSEIYDSFSKAIVECRQYEYPEDMLDAAKETDKWINSHTKEVWDFCTKILKENKDRWG